MGKNDGKDDPRLSLSRTCSGDAGAPIPEAPAFGQNMAYHGQERETDGESQHGKTRRTIKDEEAG